MTSLTAKKAFVLGIIVVLLAAIPLAVYFLQNQQQTQSRAQKATILTFSPEQNTVNAGDKFTLKIFMDPGTNEVISTDLHITYDKDLLATTVASGECGSSICSSNAFPVSNDPQYTPGNILIHLSVGTDVTKIIKTKTEIATVTFQAKTVTTTPSIINFGSQTNVTPTNADPETNVLSSGGSAYVRITAGNSITPTASPSASVAPNEPPICTGLSIDRATTGTAPFSIALTANGNDPDGTINKVTFDFGDGPVQSLTQTGGIGSKTVSVQVAHTYNNAGTYTAKVTMEDNNNTLSIPSSACSQTITVNQATGGSSSNPGGSTATPTATLTSSPVTPTSTLTMAPTNMPAPTSPGPGDKIISVGLVGAVVSIVGALLFFAL